MERTEKTVLVAYFSHTGENYSVGNIAKGNTHIVAEMLAEETGGDLFQIQTENAYPVNYNQCTAVAQKEIDEKARPKLTSAISNMQDYKTVMIGYPIWWSDAPMAVYTFLESYDFSGKTVIPFATHEGSGMSGTERLIDAAIPDAVVLDGLAIRGKTAQTDSKKARAEVIGWLKKIGLTK